MLVILVLFTIGCAKKTSYEPATANDKNINGDKDLEIDDEVADLIDIKEDEEELDQIDDIENIEELDF